MKRSHWAKFTPQITSPHAIGTSLSSDPTQTPSGRILRSTILCAGLPFIGALAFFALTFRPVVEGDGVSAYSYLHSVLVDHDLDMSNEFAAAVASGVSYHRINLSTETPTGEVADFTPIGAALLSAPAYAIALFSNTDGEPIFGRSFTTAYVLASLVYGCLGVCLSFVFATAVTRSWRSALGALVTITLASPLFYYMFLDPSYTHTFSEFVGSAFFLFWWRSGPQRGRLAWFGLGLIGGMMGMIRFQDGPLVAIALLDARNARWRAFFYLPGIVLGFLPQLLAEHMIFGSWLPTRPPDVSSFSVLPGHYLEVLFSTHNGVLLWAPIFFVGMVGVLLLHDRRLQAAALLAFLIELAMMGSQADWWGGFAFGPRRFLVLLPVFAVGLAAIIQRLPRPAAIVGCVALASWNILLVADFIYVIKADRDLGLAGLISAQAEALPYVPHIFAEGAAIRALVLWHWLDTSPDVPFGVTVLGAEAACLAFAAWVAARLVRSSIVSGPPVSRAGHTGTAGEGD
jgi:hypothetical protein